jgi:thioredoxin 1
MSGQVETVREEDFPLAVEKNRGVVLVDFWAEWCGPCRMLSPIIEEIAKEKPEIKIYKCNVDEAAGIAERFGIQSIPTLILFKNGNILDKRVGGSSKASLLEWISSKIV